MKDKEKQIEEMAIAEMIQKYLNNNNIKVSHPLLPLHIASILINNNYQKVDEDSVVIPKKITVETTPEDLIKIAKYNDSIREQARKETAEKIYRELCGHGTTYVKKWIKEQFGVEIKE